MVNRNNAKTIVKFRTLVNFNMKSSYKFLEGYRLPRIQEINVLIFHFLTWALMGNRDFVVFICVQDRN